jgi:hypothetical protein
MASMSSTNDSLMATFIFKCTNMNNMWKVPMDVPEKVGTKYLTENIPAAHNHNSFIPSKCHFLNVDSDLLIFRSL